MGLAEIIASILIGAFVLFGIVAVVVLIKDSKQKSKFGDDLKL
jgi:hypothetical protein